MQLNLTATHRVTWEDQYGQKHTVGEFEAPLEVRGNLPDLDLIAQARELLGHKTNLTTLAWWKIFPVGRWWRFAIEATRNLCRKPNYVYFLKCLMEAASNSPKLAQFYALLKRLGKTMSDRLDEAVRKVAGLLDDPHPGCPGCENCAEKKVAYWKAQGLQVPMKRVREGDESVARLNARLSGRG